MDLFSTYNKNNSFFLKMSDYAGSSFDNEAAMGQRMSLIYIDSGSGIAKINHTSVAYMAPCVFCINEQEHIVIPDSKENVLMVLYFHPCIINSSLTFDILRKLPDDISLTLMQDSSLLKLFVNRADNYIGKFNLGPLSAKQFTTLYSNIHELINIQADINWPCRSRSYLMWLLFLLQNLYDKGMFSDDTLLGEVNEKLAPILQYIYNNYEKKITIADITGNFYISKTLWRTGRMFIPHIYQQTKDNYGFHYA